MGVSMGDILLGRANGGVLATINGGLLGAAGMMLAKPGRWKPRIMGETARLDGRESLVRARDAWMRRA